MKKMLLAALGAAAALTAVVPAAQAAQGCGPGGHRGYYGACRPNFGPGPVYGSFYAGRGWWDGHRYWGHRHHWHGGWRYY